MSWQPTHLRKADIEAIWQQYTREIEAAEMREHLTQLTRRVMGGDRYELEESGKLHKLLEMERERLKSLAPDGGE